jgi:hypothetical protein
MDVAEEPAAKHLAELVLGLLESLLGSLANSPGGVEEVLLSSRVTIEDVEEHARYVLRRRGAALCWKFEETHRWILITLKFGYAALL